MNVEHKEFIGYYRGLYPTGYCEHLIKEFNRLKENGAGSNRQQSEKAHRHVKDDYQIGVELRNHAVMPFKSIETDDNGLAKEFERDSCDLFFKGLQACYDEYTEKYSILKVSGGISATTMKMQCTGPGGGYHVWHGEQGSGAHANRVVVYMVYLNSFEDGDGGETEFLYQRTRVRPEENLMLLWPASYTHAHRGNPVLVDKYKYIVTGWFYYD